MAGKSRIQVTPEMMALLAQYAGAQIPPERLADIAASLQGIADTLDSADSARLRDIEPAHIQPHRWEGK